MSRAFVINEALNPETVLRDSLSSLDEDIINEVVIEAAQGVEKDSLEIRQRRLESIEFQQEVCALLCLCCSAYHNQLRGSYR